MKKVMISVISSALCFGLVSPVLTSAAPITSAVEVDQMTPEKQNFVFLEGNPGDLHLVYTYESEGITYKVDEHSNEDFTEIHSIIYQKEANGEFVEFSTQDTTIDSENSLIKLTTDQGGVISSEAQSVKSIEPIVSGIPAIHSDRGDSFTTMDSYNGTPVKPWVYNSWKEGSSSIARYTLTGVVGALSLIAVDYAPGAYKLGAAAIGAMATLFVADNVQTVYYKQRYGQKNSAVAPSVIVANQIDTLYYSEPGFKYLKGRTNPIRSLPGYVE
ncbi:hypothetical protein [Saccharibacillus deserti]|uniref:hypothetical protein n=1 Tax=Saccharibacillus deserti TaxID=1634444 RepID=UPI001553E9FF|nr:hypothetical protein [Saccharibacillus deserti]